MFPKILDKIKELMGDKTLSNTDKIDKSTGGKPLSHADKISKPMGVKTLSDADLMVVLEKKAKGMDLDWKYSVVDFLKLLGISSSRENRDALAAELGIDPALESGSAAKNEALRVAVFKKLAENGGNIPNSLLD